MEMLHLARIQDLSAGDTFELGDMDGTLMLSDEIEETSTPRSFMAMSISTGWIVHILENTVVNRVPNPLENSVPGPVSAPHPPTVHITLPSVMHNGSQIKITISPVER